MGRSRRLLVPALAGLLVLGALARALAFAPNLGVIRAAADFTLIGAAGRDVRLHDLRGRVVLLSFIYTSCPSACPLITQRMALLHRRLVEARLLPSRVTLVSITVDPERDSPAVLARYAKAFAAHPQGWFFLRDDAEHLRAVLGQWDEWTRPQAGGEIDHPARIHLLDARGRVREIYSLALFDEREAFVDIRALVNESH